MRHFVQKKLQHRHGFTLLETLLVVGILSILITISVTSTVLVRKNMRFREHNDNAHAIYMAAQSNLTQMRSMGELPLLEEAANSDRDAAIGGNCRLSYSRGTGNSYDILVPTSLDAHVRSQQVILEYHPTAGIIYAVFYYEGSDSLLELYTYHTSIREDEDLRKDLMIGYYSVGDVDAINSGDFTLYQISADIAYTNADEGILTISVPVKDQKGFDMFTDVDAYRYIASRLEILLTISGQHGGQITKTYRVMDNTGTPALNFTGDNTQYKLHVEIPLDSLTDSFTNLGLDLVGGTLQNPIAAGDNISVTADLTFSPAADDPILIINSATISDINPMYHGLTENPEYDPNQTGIRPYILTISNGRHLQNLNLLDPEFAKNIASIQFVKEQECDGDFILDWYGDVDFVPISLTNVPKIDGNGVTIRSLRVCSPSGVTVAGSTKRFAGLFAALSDTTIQNITLADSHFETSDAIATGGLVGFADGVTIENCHISGSSVIGSGNVGGLAGSTLDTAITSCTVESTSVSSISSTGTDSSKNALGGLIGYASNSGTNTSFAITGCESKSSVTVTGVTDSLNDLGGMVGYAKNAYFSQCKSSALVTGHGTTIPNNNLGGFVGKSEGSRYAVIDVTLNYLPQYAADAGGFAGILSGDSIENLDVVFTSNSNAKTTLTNFGGIASVNSGGTITRATVIGTNAPSESKSNQATHAAGFVVTNTGTIRRSFSNVNMDGGFCFVKSNGGTVKNCYGWAWGNDNAFELANCTHSYFVDGNNNQVYFYDESGTLSGRIPDTGALADDQTVNLLNSTNDAPWIANSTISYPYPVLKDVVHGGKHTSPVTVPYPYALRYVEDYGYGTGDLLVIYDESGEIIDTIDNLRDETVYDTAYYLYHRTETGLINRNLLGTYDSDSAVFQAGWESIDHLAPTELFTAYQLAEDASFPDLNLQTYYPLYGASGGYRIRTGEQFLNIAQNPGGVFYLDHDITVSATVSSFRGKLYGNDHTVSALVPLFGTVSSDAVIENCHVETDGTFQPFGQLPGTTIDATHWTATAQSTASVDSFDSIFNAVEGTPRKITLDLPGCTINGESALVTRHYYQIDTSCIQINSGSSSSVQLNPAQNLTYRDLTENDTYYVKSAEGSSYELLTVSISESGLTLSAGSFYLEKTLEDLDAAVEIPLYTISGSIPGNITGNCHLMMGNQYLTADGALVDSLPEDDSWIWTGNGDGSYSNSGMTVTLYTPDGRLVTSMDFSGTCTVQEIIRTYPSQYVGEATVMKEAVYD